MAKPVRIVIHHSANPTKEAQLGITNVYHASKGFLKSTLGYHVGYSYFIERDGKTIQTRTDTEEQAHTKGLNYDSIGICLAGDFSQERPSFEQTLALKNLINQKMREYGILPSGISGHRMLRDTECPGSKVTEKELRDLFMPDISYYQNLLNTLRELLEKLLQRSTKVGHEIDNTCDK